MTETIESLKKEIIGLKYRINPLTNKIEETHKIINLLKSKIEEQDKIIKRQRDFNRKLMENHRTQKVKWDKIKRRLQKFIVTS